jgi:hypothetical protein
MKNKLPITKIQRLFPFLFSPSTPLRAVSLSNGSFDSRKNILINSSVCCKISSNNSGFLISGARWISFNHLWVSLSSFNEILALVFVFDSTFDVGRSMFDVHYFSVNLPHSPRVKIT